MEIGGQQHICLLMVLTGMFWLHTVFLFFETKMTQRSKKKLAFSSVLEGKSATKNFFEIVPKKPEGFCRI